MKLLCFLGNVGMQYHQTRHNVGWIMADFVHDAWNLNPWQEDKKLFSFWCEHHIAGEKIILIKPTTFMNLSGKALLAVSSFYKISLDDMLIIYDDKDVPFGQIRYKAQGSARGQNGMKDCIRSMGTDAIHRITIGIGNNTQHLFSDPADFVLSCFSNDEQISLSHTIFPSALDQIQQWIREKK